jgi:hypothetical protein
VLHAAIESRPALDSSDRLADSPAGCSPRRAALQVAAHPRGAPVRTRSSSSRFRPSPVRRSPSGVRYHLHCTREDRDGTIRGDCPSVYASEFPPRGVRWQRRPRLGPVLDHTPAVASRPDLAPDPAGVRLAKRVTPSWQLLKGIHSLHNGKFAIAILSVALLGGACGSDDGPAPQGAPPDASPDAATYDWDAQLERLTVHGTGGECSSSSNCSLSASTGDGQSWTTICVPPGFQASLSQQFDDCELIRQFQPTCSGTLCGPSIREVERYNDKAMLVTFAEGPLGCISGFTCTTNGDDMECVRSGGSGARSDCEPPGSKECAGCSAGTSGICKGVFNRCYSPQLGSECSDGEAC